MVKEGTQTNEPEDKVVDVDAQDLTSERLHGYQTSRKDYMDIMRQEKKKEEHWR